MHSILGRLAALIPHRAPLARRMPAAANRVSSIEFLESRLLLSPWDTNWQYGPPPGAQPPPQPLPEPPYGCSFETSIDSNIAEVPGQGHVLLKNVKATSKTFKGTIDETSVHGKFNLKGHFQNSASPSDTDTFTGTLSFKVTEPGSKPQHYKLQIVGHHAPAN